MKAQVTLSIYSFVWIQRRINVQWRSRKTACSLPCCKTRRTLSWTLHKLEKFTKEMFLRTSDVQHILLLSPPETSASKEREIFLLASRLPCDVQRCGGFKMESISKSPQPADRLCSGNLKQLRKQSRTAPLLQLWAFVNLREDFGSAATEFQILFQIILNQHDLKTACVRLGYG